MAFKKPDCSTWGIWEGPEIEGHDDLGTMTLFVRYGDPVQYFPKYERIWFCKEFLNNRFYHGVIMLALLMKKKVCIEVMPESVHRVDADILEKGAKLYLKIEANLRPGDHVCVGTAFKDQAFKIGEGAHVEPHQYAQDKRLE